MFIGKDRVYAGAIIAALLLFFTTILGFTGTRTLFFFALLYFIPSYIILNWFDIGASEKVIFSIFLGIGIFPSIAYGIGFLTGSLKAALWLTLVLMLGLGILLNLVFKPNKTEHKSL